MEGNGKPEGRNLSGYRELIVYACPTGELAADLDIYFATVKHRCGFNTAHQYMPHVTLTGFFHDDVDSIPSYMEGLEKALVLEGANKPERAIAISGLRIEPEFHYLGIQSPWLEAVIAKFAALVDSPTRIDALRIKRNLHLSLAYGFDLEQGEALREIAGELDWQVSVGWDLRFYERHSGSDGMSVASEPEDLVRYWTCHGCWEV